MSYRSFRSFAFCQGGKYGVIPISKYQHQYSARSQYLLTIVDVPSVWQDVLHANFITMHQSSVNLVFNPNHIVALSFFTGHHSAPSLIYGTPLPHSLACRWPIDTWPSDSSFIFRISSLFANLGFITAQFTRYRFNIWLVRAIVVKN